MPNLSLVKIKTLNPKSTKIIGQPAHQSRLEIMIMLKQA